MKKKLTLFNSDMFTAHMSALYKFIRLLLSPTLLFIVLFTGCLERLDYQIPKTASQSISVSGYISNQPPPYEVRIYNLFDIESKETTKTPVSAKRVELFDHNGSSESFTEMNPGIYQTSAQGIHGVVGGVYKIQVELTDGRLYESIPDTILAPGKMDSLYIRYTKKYTALYVEKYYMDVLFDASYDTHGGNKFMWRLTTTFKGTTQPEENHGQCFWFPDIGQCNWVPPCSGYRNIGSNANPIFEKQYPCTCCDCWYNIYNDNIMLSEQFVEYSKLSSVLLKSIPVSPWMFQYKTRVDVSQLSLTTRAFRFWRAITKQREAIGSLFQPVAGIIPIGFIQLEGNEIPVQGIFYATGVSSKTQIIKKDDLPVIVYITLPTDSLYFADDCRYLFSNSSNLKPPFWRD